MLKKNRKRKNFDFMKRSSRSVEDPRRHREDPSG
jgi:hypothetical protein